MFVRCRASGQSSVELLLAAAFLIPVVIMMPTIANLLLVQTETHKASRYLAWERTAYATADLKSNEDLSQDIRTRFFEDPESSFGTNGKSTFVPPWRDFGNSQSILDLSEEVIEIRSEGAHSATAESQNASAWLANRGGDGNPANRVELNTLQVTKLSVPIRSDASVFRLTKPVTVWHHINDANKNPEIPIDPLSETERFYLASSSALVSDSWAPANEQMFRDRVAGMNRGNNSLQRGWEGLLAPIGNVFDELGEHLYVNSEFKESFNMADDRQSVVLPSNLKEYAGQ